MTFYFPDLSYYEPGANIAKILEQSGGVLAIRAGHGDFHDPKFNGWRLAASKAKVLLIYHFVDKKDGTPEDNADLFYDHLGGKRFANEVLVMDVESGSGAWSLAECKRYHAEVRKALGGPPLVTYSNEGYVLEHGLKPLFTVTHGWVAKWGAAGKDASKPAVPHLIWQHAADGFGKPRVLWAGTSKTTDENRVDGLDQNGFRDVLLGAKPAVTDCSD